MDQNDSDEEPTNEDTKSPRRRIRRRHKPTLAGVAPAPNQIAVPLPEDVEVPKPDLGTDASVSKEDIRAQLELPSPRRRRGTPKATTLGWPGLPKTPERSDRTELIVGRGAPPPMAGEKMPESGVSEDSVAALVKDLVDTAEEGLKKNDAPAAMQEDDDDDERSTSMLPIDEKEDDEDERSTSMLPIDEKEDDEDERNTSMLPIDEKEGDEDERSTSLSSAPEDDTAQTSLSSKPLHSLPGTWPSNAPELEETVKASPEIFAQLLAEDEEKKAILDQPENTSASEIATANVDSDDGAYTPSELSEIPQATPPSAPPKAAEIEPQLTIDAHEETEDDPQLPRGGARTGVLIGVAVGLLAIGGYVASQFLGQTTAGSTESTPRITHQESSSEDDPSAVPSDTIDTQNTAVETEHSETQASEANSSDTEIESTTTDSEEAPATETETATFESDETTATETETATVESDETTAVVAEIPSETTENQERPSPANPALINPNYEVILPGPNEETRSASALQKITAIRRYRSIGRREFRDENYEAARAAWTNALRFSPRDASSMQGLARIAAIEGNYSEAVAWAQRALQFDRSSATAYRVLGDMYRDAGHIDRARRAYSRGLRRHPGHPVLSRRRRELQNN